MLTKFAALGAAVAAIAAATVAATPATTGVFANSTDPNDEAPRIMLDPTADNTDLYAFTAQDAPGQLTTAANWVPLQNPAGGPYFGKLDPEAHYYRSSIGLGNQGGGQDSVSGFSAHSF